VYENVGIVPQIYFQYVYQNFVWKLTGKPFNLTATVVSNLNLTSLYWSPPKLSGPLSNRTVTFRDGNITTTTFMLSEITTKGKSGNYTLTTINKCGQNSSQVKIQILTSKIIDYIYNAMIKFVNIVRS